MTSPFVILAMTKHSVNLTASSSHIYEAHCQTLSLQEVFDEAISRRERGCTSTWDCLVEDS